jgi:regulator of protease activity HflC (stomatin/prohibitin superfamily)
MPNPYYVPVQPKAKLGMIIQAHAKEAKQGTATFITRLIMETYKEEYIKMWGQEDFDAYMKELTLDIDIQQKQKLEKEKAKQTAREDRLALKRKALDLKERELEIRSNNTEIREAPIKAEEERKRILEEKQKPKEPNPNQLILKEVLEKGVEAKKKAEEEAKKKSKPEPEKKDPMNELWGEGGIFDKPKSDKYGE